jgi:hypothetical protein
LPKDGQSLVDLKAYRPDFRVRVLTPGDSVEVND